LRIWGYDTVYWRGPIDRNFLRKGAGEGRVVLTRRRDMAERNFSGRMIVIENDKIADQAMEIIEKLSLKPDPSGFFSICLKCNERLREIPKSKIKEQVPDYVFQNHDKFRICPQCGSVFWAGTHKNRMLRFIETCVDTRP
jgi:hypothetical protein